MRALQSLNKYFFKYKYHFLTGVIITIVAQIFTLYTPKLVGDSIRILEQLNTFDKEKVTELLFSNIFWILVTTLKLSRVINVGKAEVIPIGILLLVFNTKKKS